jgi:hypothetical protein
MGVFPKLGINASAAAAAFDPIEKINAPPRPLILSHSLAPTR